MSRLRRVRFPEGGKHRGIGDPAADDVQGAGKRYSVGVDVDGVGRFDHERSYRVMGEEQPVDFLPDKFGFLRSDPFPGAQIYLYLAKR